MKKNVRVNPGKKCFICIRFLSYLVYKMYAIRKFISLSKQENKSLMCLGFEVCEFTWQDPKSFENLFYKMLNIGIKLVKRSMLFPSSGSWSLGAGFFPTGTHKLLKRRKEYLYKKYIFSF